MRGKFLSLLAVFALMVSVGAGSARAQRTEGVACQGPPDELLELISTTRTRLMFFDNMSTPPYFCPDCSDEWAAFLDVADDFDTFVDAFPGSMPTSDCWMCVGTPPVWQYNDDVCWDPISQTWVNCTPLDICQERYEALLDLLVSSHNQGYWLYLRCVQNSCGYTTPPDPDDPYDPRKEFPSCFTNPPNNSHCLPQSVMPPLVNPSWESEFVPECAGWPALDLNPSMTEPHQRWNPDLDIYPGIDIEFDFHCVPPAEPPTVLVPGPIAWIRSAIWDAWWTMAATLAGTAEITSYDPLTYDATDVAAAVATYNATLEDIFAEYDLRWRAYNAAHGIPECIGDWNGDDGIDGDDITAFFVDWDNNDGDANRDGGTDGDDVTVFFDVWDASACY